MFHAIVAWRVRPRAAPSDDVVRDGLHGTAIVRLLHHVQLDAVHLASIGYDASTAGVHLFIFQGIGIFSGLLIPKFMNVRGNQVCAALTASAPMLIAGLGMLLLPHLMPVWAFVGGCAQGASLVVALALIALRGRDSAETVVLSGVAQSFGYLIASLGPLMFGVLVQATGGHHVPLMVFTFVAFLQCVVAVIVGRPSKM